MDIILNIEYINIQLHGYNPKYRVYEYTDTYKYIVLIHGFNPKHRVKDNIYIDTQAGRNFEVLRKSAINTISVVRMAFYSPDCC